MSLDLDTIEQNLKKQWKYIYIWMRKQNDLWDDATKFIYKTIIWEELLVAIEVKLEENDFDKNAFFNLKEFSEACLVGK